MSLRSTCIGAAVMVFGVIGLSAALPQSASAEPPSTCNTSLLTFPAWYKGMTDDSCNFQPIKSSDGSVDLKATILAIALNIVQAILQLVGYVTVVMIIIGGFNYMTSQGDSNKMSSAKNTITNALIGLIISIFSVAIVQLVAHSI